MKEHIQWIFSIYTRSHVVNFVFEGNFRVSERYNLRPNRGQLEQKQFLGAQLGIEPAAELY